MPNWCEGTIKIRGKIDDIVEFLKNGIEIQGDVYATDENGQLKVGKRETSKNIEYDKETDTLTFSFMGSGAYIKDTSRAFIDQVDYEFWLDADDETEVICFPFMQAWGFCPDEFVELSKKYKLDFRLYGIEQGMQFIMEVIVENGKLTKCETRAEFKNNNEWIWECPFPYMGG